jgi:octopine/nopaline transport system substrate-binding protein
MKTLVSAMALFVSSNVIAAVAVQTLKSFKFIALGVSLTAALAPTGFAKEWKTVAIGMDEAYAPWHFTDSSGKMVGFDVDLAMDLCQRAAFECKIVTQDWDGLIPELKAGKFDVIISGMAITDERKKEIDFSEPYARTPVAFMAAKDSPVANALGPGKVVNIEKDPAAGDAAIKALQAAMKGRTIGVPSSSFQLKFANEHLKDVATVKEYKNQNDRDLDLKSGRIDLAFDSAPAIAVVIDKPDSKNLEIVGPEFVWSHGGVGIGVRKSDADLTAAFNQALDAAFADGSVQKYSIKWFKVDTTPSDK